MHVNNVIRIKRKQNCGLNIEKQDLFAYKNPIFIFNFLDLLPTPRSRWMSYRKIHSTWNLYSRGKYQEAKTALYDNILFD